MDRKALVFIKKKFGTRTIIGAEVGVAIGTNAFRILQNLSNVKLLYLIDPYIHYSEWVSTRAKDRRFWPEDLTPIKKEATILLASFNERICWVYKKFEECTYEDIPDPLDFIYIDGNHAYEYVKKDIEIARKLVNKGGVVSGHDFRLGSTTPDSMEVYKAVTEYCRKHNVIFSHENEDWWFIN